VSSSTGSGTPSFGDLFDDPDGSEHPAAPVLDPGAETPRPVTLPRGSHDTADHAPVAASDEPAATPHPEPHVQVEPVEVARTYRAEHDLDHESSEASHLVAGFEHDEPEEPRAGAVAVAAAGAAAGGTAAARREPWDGVPDPAVASVPAGRVDTGRLYRSSGAEGPATLDAIPAIDPGRAPGAAVATAAPARPAAKAASVARGTGLTYSGVVVVIVAATVVAAFVEALLRHQIGWLTGLALLVSSVYCAVVVRRPDIWAAVVVPPLAFLVASLTAGQLTLDQTGSLLIREGYGLFRNLAVNAPWILGTTLICLVIVLVRRKRG
jgi:hypothetical protein